MLEQKNALPHQFLYILYDGIVDCHNGRAKFPLLEKSVFDVVNIFRGWMILISSKSHVKGDKNGLE